VDEALSGRFFLFPISFDSRSIVISGNLPAKHPPKNAYPPGGDPSVLPLVTERFSFYLTWMYYE